MQTDVDFCFLHMARGRGQAVAQVCTRMMEDMATFSTAITVMDDYDPFADSALLDTSAGARDDDEHAESRYVALAARATCSRRCCRAPCAHARLLPSSPRPSGSHERARLRPSPL